MSIPIHGYRAAPIPLLTWTMQRVATIPKRLWGKNLNQLKLSRIDGFVMDCNQLQSCVIGLGIAPKGAGNSVEN